MSAGGLGFTRNNLRARQRDTLRFDTLYRIHMSMAEVSTVHKSDLPQGTLDLLILKIVALGPLHGYAIARRLQQISRDVVHVQQGTLYPALHRLENRGYLSAEWKASDTGRDAKIYSLTRKGRAHMSSEAAGWQRLTEAIALILRTDGGVP